MAFFTRYRALRQVDETGSDEVEYNFGRAFQQLGEDVPSTSSRSRAYCKYRSS